MLPLTSFLLSLTALVVVLAAPAAAADHAPAVRANLPTTVPAPPHPDSRPPRVVRERPATSPPSSSDASTAAKVNINTADLKTLMTLPGVSRKIAQQIVAYRDEHGPFKRASDLRKVDGVGETVWEKNRGRIVTK